ncbi:hypothetical protein [Flectobacillus major]|uniref:hypothetical protein n=1 Tax=Flectobacillus major TaxID=103 RepID=UPI000428D0AA|nr:hypothetical protein [Flectobacillus major]
MQKTIYLLIFYLSISLYSANKVYAQAFSDENIYISTTIGLNSYYRSIPISFSYEWPVSSKESLSFLLDTNFGKYPSSFLPGDNWDYKAFNMSIRYSYHLSELLHQKNENIDHYVGGGLGFQHFKWNNELQGYRYNFRNGISLDYYLGTRYFFSERVGFCLEVGSIGISNIRIGTTFRL